MPSGSQIAAFKAGGWSEFLAERAVKYADKKYHLSERANKKLQNLNMTYASMYNRRPVTPIYHRRLRAIAPRASNRDRKKRRVTVPPPMVRRPYSAHRAFGKSNIGEPVGTANTKNVSITETLTPTSRTLYKINVTQIARGSTISDRNRDIINCRGFDLSCYFRNTSTLVDETLFVNCALIAPKTSLAVTEQDFFRSQSSLDTRDRTFSTALTAE